MAEQENANWEAFKNFGKNQYFQMGVQGAGAIADAFPTPRTDLNSNNLMAAGVRDAMSDTMLLAGGYTALGGLFLKGMDKSGLFTDASQGLGKGYDAANMIGSILLPGANLFMNSTNSYKQSADMQAMAGGYADAAKNAQTAEKNAGAKLLFGQGKANNSINLARALDKMISGIKQQTDQDYQATASMTQSMAMRDQLAYAGGYNQALARVGKSGMKLLRARRISLLAENPAIEKQEVESLKESEKIIKKAIKGPDEFFKKIFLFKEGGKTNETELTESVQLLTPEWITFDETTGYYMTPFKFGDLKGRKLRKEWEKSEIGKKWMTDNDLVPFKTDSNIWSYIPRSEYDKIFSGGFGAGPGNFDDWVEEGNNNHVYGKTVEIDGRTMTPLVGEYDSQGRQKYQGDDGLIYAFKDGGNIEKEESEEDLNSTPNVIPEGNLHARLHHMENADELTKKGIPVVDNDGNQQAEIELNEIIFNLEVTKKLEELRNKYKEENKDEYAIEAGKMIALQVMENTEDRTGLMQTVS